MKSDTVTVQEVFQDRRQYRVPFYQRPYVWSEEEQWKPLWDDIVEKAESRLENAETVAPHFLGAIVLEPQPRDGLRGVESFHVIDGQQRLTTLQYFLAALTIAVRDKKVDAILPILEGCIWNSNTDTMKQPEVEVFKLWPTFRDRASFDAALKSESLEALKARFPASFTQAGALRKIGVDHPPSLEAIWYFRAEIEKWVAGREDVLTLLEKLAEAALQYLKFVSIVLEPQDDAQVIFETLNGRGAELHATDLIRNFIFMRADRDGADAGLLYSSLWCQFEDPFWAQPQRRGRLKRPRLEWFMQSTLQAELGEETDVGRLYEGYKRFAQPTPAQRQLEKLSVYGEKYRQFILGSDDHPVGKFGRQIAAWDASPVHPLALAVACSNLPADIQEKIFDDLVSYVVRRAICGLSNKSYNKVFLQLLKRIREGNLTRERVHSALSSLKGDTSRWPTDREFMSAWLNEPIVGRLGEVARVRSVLATLELGLRSSKSEEKTLSDMSDLDVDHILPERWFEHWPIDGVPVAKEELDKAGLGLWSLDEESSPRQQKILRRQKLKHTIGNLTLLHYGVNRSLQHCAFDKKRDALFKVSNLQLNRPLMIAADWDEEAIEARGRDLFEVAVKAWAGPAN